MASRLLPLSLVVAALALVAVDPSAGGGFTLRPGAVLLLGGAGAALIWRGRWISAVALVLALLVGSVSLRQGLADIGGDRGAGVAVVRVLGLAALLVAVTAAFCRLLAGWRPVVGRRTAREAKPARDWSRPGQVLGLVVLCAVGAELLAAYGDSTGDPRGIAFAVVIFAALYGAPALLVREVVRRCGWGWPSMLLLFAALGVTEACLIDQSLFSSDYQGYEGWEATREATLISALGVSAFNAYNFLLGHVIFSFGAPVAVAEAWRPDRARDPWLGPVGIGVALLAYAGVAALIVSDPESHSGSVTQLAVAAGVVVTLAIGAVIVGVRGARKPTVQTPSEPRLLPVWAVLLSSLVAALVTGMASETWGGFAVGMTVTCLLGFGVLVAARHPGWSIRHVAAVGLGFLFARGLLAFTYFPLIGDVEPAPKYLHNTAMLLLVAAAAWLALRTTVLVRPRPSLEDAGQEAPSVPFSQ